MQRSQEHCKSSQSHFPLGAHAPASPALLLVVLCNSAASLQLVVLCNLCDILIDHLRAMRIQSKIIDLVSSHGTGYADETGRGAVEVSADNTVRSRVPRRAGGIP